MYDVIIIGAGAAGLAAAKKLSEEGYRLCVLEAASIAGGRIATIRENGFTSPVECGAEFIHGKLPLTFQLLKEAGISYEAVEGDMIGVRNGTWEREEHGDHWNKFMHELQRLKKDITILEFLDTHFPGQEYIQLRKAVQRFAEGFDLADISKASILSVKREWKNIEKKQYRVKGGYMQLINYLSGYCLQRNILFYFDTVAEIVEYNRNSVKILTTGNKKLEANKLVITVSLGVLQSGSIQFKPPLSAHATAIQSLGFGAVIKFLLEFKTGFWNESHNDIGFLLTDEEIPTWWTQLPAQSSLLTGWLGGPKAIEKVFETDDALLQIALHSLSSIFHLPVPRLREQLAHYKICRWQNEPYIKGGYCYNTPGSESAKRILSSPVDNAVFFAGEALSPDESPGTVESALKSGFQTANAVIKCFQPAKES